MYRFLNRHLPRWLAVGLTAIGYALLMVLIASKWHIGNGAFRYLGI